MRLVPECTSHFYTFGTSKIDEFDCIVTLQQSCFWYDIANLNAAFIFVLLYLCFHYIRTNWVSASAALVECYHGLSVKHLSICVWFVCRLTAELLTCSLILWTWNRWLVFDRSICKVWKIDIMANVMYRVSIYYSSLICERLFWAHYICVYFFAGVGEISFYLYSVSLLYIPSLADILL